MALVWGSVVGNNGGFKIGMDLWYVRSTDSTYTIAGYIYEYSAYAFNDVNNSYAQSGHFGSDSGSVDFGSTASGTRNVHEIPETTFDRNYGADRTVTQYASLAGLDYFGSGYSASVANSYLVPARPWDLPAAPTALTNTRNSDTSNSVAWTNNATEHAPYDYVYVYRSTDGGAYTQIARVSGTATGYEDTTTSADHSYDYKARAWNSSGYSDYSAAAGITYNTPAAPTNCTATKTGATTVTVAWDDTSNTETGFEIQLTTDAGANWTAVDTAAAGAETYEDTSVPGGTVAYRVRATRGALVSAWSNTSNSVNTIAPPAAPTITSAWGVYSVAGDTLSIGWNHNTLDGSAQTKAEIYYSIDGVDASGIVNGTGNTYDIDISGASPTKIVTAKVRTWGIDASAGPYSATVQTTLANAPQVNITTPESDGYDVLDLPLVAAWDYTDDFELASWSLALRKGTGGAIQVKTWSGTTETSQSIGFEYLLNNTEYTLLLTARSGSGLTATASRTFDTAYLAPSVPFVSAVFDQETLSAAITAVAGADASGIPATDHLSLQRIETFRGVEETETLVDPITDGSAYVDLTPRLGSDVEVTYRVLAHAANGAYSYTDLMLDTTPDFNASAFNYGADYSSVCIISANASIALNQTDDSQVMVFADNEDPVLFPGEHVFFSPSFEGDIINDAAMENAAYGLQEWGGRRVIFRDPVGFRCAVSARTDIVRDVGARKITVSVDMGKVQ